MANITPWKDGKFRVNWRDGSGVQHNKYLSKRLAQELYDEICAQRVFESSGMASVLGLKSKNFRKMTFETLANRYVEEHLLPLTRAESNVYYVKILIHKWGKFRLSQLNTTEFKNWIMFALKNPILTPKLESWKTTKLSASSVKKLVRYMTRIFYWSKQQGLIDNNPFANILPKKDPLNKEIRRQTTFKPVVLSTEEFWGMANSFPDYVRYPVIALFFSGIRRSELVAVRWSKVNRKERRFEFEANELKESDDKNVYYDTELETVLETLYLDYITAGHCDDVVFRNEKGFALTDDSLSHSVRYHCDEYAKKSNNPKFLKVTPHTFRRSYCTRKAIEGADRKALCANMGHHSESTNAIYNIMNDERQRTIAGSLSNCPQNVKAALESAIEAARASGFDLSEMQSELRQSWKSPRYSALLPNSSDSIN